MECGINASNFQLFIAFRHVYVAELLEKDILVYERQDDNSLVLKQVFKLYHLHVHF